MTATIGELCAGYGGLGMGVAQVLDAAVAWYSDIDKGALKILEHRFPGVPNIGDMTTVDWATVPKVDILCAGYPCQPFSHAGKRKGADDSRHLWPHVREAIRHLRPGLTLLENVSGHRSLGFDRVLGDLAEDGMHVVWTSVRASDVGAPHRRERLFIGVAHAESDAGWVEHGDSAPAPDDHKQGLGVLGWQHAEQRDADGCGGANESGASQQSTSLLPSPRTSGTKGTGAHGDGGLDLRTAVSMLPTPMARDHKGAGPGDLKRHNPNLSAVAGLLPTPTTEPMTGNGHARCLGGEVKPNRWGEYAGAVARWEHLTRQAPDPTMRSKRGTPQLSPRFSEWMMGVPSGWVTDVPGITRNEALRAIGNGVLPQQCAAAAAYLLHLLATQGVPA